jgi:hypothetical protein
MVEYGTLASRGGGGGASSDVMDNLRRGVSFVVDFAQDNPWQFGGGVVVFIVVIMFLFRGKSVR